MSEIEQAKAAEITQEQIDAYRQKRLKECNEAVERMLRFYNCDLIAIPRFAPDGRIVADVRLVPK